MALALGVGATSVLGPIVSGVIDYHVSQDMLNQVIGADAVALVLVAPATMALAILALLRHPASLVLAPGPALFAMYLYGQLAIGQEFDRYPGNSEQFFPLLLALFVLGGVVAAAAWTQLDVERLAPLSPRGRRIAGAFLFLVVAFLVLGLHLPGLLDAWSEQPQSTEYLENPTVFWVVKLMDLGIIVPVAVAAGVGVLRGAPRAQQALYALVAWFTLLGAAVAAMAMTMLINDDPAASVGLAIGFTAAAAGFAVLAAWLYRPLFPSPFPRG